MFTGLCVAKLLQAWLSIPSKMLPFRSHLSKKAPPFRFLTSLTLVTNRVSLRPGSLLGIYLPTQKNKTCLMTGLIFLTGSYLSSQAASSQVLSTYKGLTTVFGMGTGGSPQPSPPDYSILRLYPQNFNRRISLDQAYFLSQALDILVSVR